MFKMGYHSIRPVLLPLALAWILVASIVTPVRAKALSQHRGKVLAKTPIPVSLLTNRFC